MFDLLIKYNKFIVCNNLTERQRHFRAADIPNYFSTSTVSLNTQSETDPGVSSVTSSYRIYEPGTNTHNLHDYIVSCTVCR